MKWNSFETESVYKTGFIRDLVDYYKERINACTREEELYYVKYDLDDLKNNIQGLFAGFMGEKSVECISLPNIHDENWIDNVDWEQLTRTVHNAVAYV